MGNSNIRHEEIEGIPLREMTSSSCRQIYPSREHINQLTLIWLDKSAEEYSPDVLRRKCLLDEISNNKCLFFDNCNDFFDKIEELKGQENEILIIMSGSYAEKIVPLEKDINAKKIIFCKDYSKYAHWKNEQDSNVLDVCTEDEILKYSIYREYPALKFNLFINQTLKSTKVLSPLKDDNDDPYFSYILFIEILKQMQQTDEAKEFMLKKSQDFYTGNETFRRYIENFRRNYESNQAIDRYIEKSFVFSLVNQAFRTEDVMLWYTFRYYIVDLCKQLEITHKKQKRNNQKSIVVYRGQPWMSTNEFEYLNLKIGHRIGTNGFFSTSKDENIAKGFIAGVQSNDHFKTILFEIIVDVPNLQNVIFVDIDQYTGTQMEDEILFNIGTIFLIESIEHDNEMNIEKIRMKATDEGTSQIKIRLDKKLKQFQNGNINLLFGQLLLEMKEYPTAQSYFQMLSLFIPKSHQDLAFVYHHLGELNMRITDWNEAFKYFNLADQINRKKFCPNDPQIGATFNSIANYYKAIRNNLQALTYYNKALECKLDPYNRVATQLNISTVHIFNKDYQKAIHLCSEARIILAQNKPFYAEIICRRRIIGQIYLAQENYAAAEKSYCKALEISRKFLTIADYNQTKCVKALANFYHKQGKHQQAMDLCSDHLTECERDLPFDHMNIAHILIKIGELYNDNDDRKKSVLERALNILKKTNHLQYATIARCLIMIGQYYQKQNNSEIDEKYYRGAFQIRKKIYPENHSIISETQRLLMQTKVKHS